jgi:hypothetical protein
MRTVVITLAVLRCAASRRSLPMILTKEDDDTGDKIQNWQSIVIES